MGTISASTSRGPITAPAVNTWRFTTSPRGRRDDDLAARGVLAGRSRSSRSKSRVVVSLSSSAACWRKLLHERGHAQLQLGDAAARLRELGAVFLAARLVLRHRALEAQHARPLDEVLLEQLAVERELLLLQGKRAVFGLHLVCERGRLFLALDDLAVE